MIIDELDSLVGNLKTLDFKTLNDKQREVVREEHNTYLSGLKYARNGESVIFVCNEGVYSRLLHYIALEYEQDCLEYYLKVGDEIVTSYRDSSIADRLYSLLEFKE